MGYWPPGKCSINMSCHYYSSFTLIWTGDEDTEMDEDMGVKMGKQEIWDDLGLSPGSRDDHIDI